MNVICEGVGRAAGAVRDKMLSKGENNRVAEVESVKEKRNVTKQYLSRRGIKPGGKKNCAGGLRIKPKVRGSARSMGRSLDLMRDKKGNRESGTRTV